MQATLIDTDMPARLRAIVGKLSRRLSAESRGSGLTPSQLSVLGVIARSGRVRLSELSEIEGLNPTMLSRVVGVLEDQGLVRRSVDTADRRAGLVEITAAGRRTHDRLRQQRGALLASALGGLDPDDVAAIERALPALEALVEAAGRKGITR